jgi:two-component system sensor histidine kinase/response regulator
VLVVEDNETSRELLEMFLAGWSIPAVAVASAEEGLALVERRNVSGSPDAFGLVVLDWMLPGMNGLDMAARIRAREQTRALPIVLTSAYAGKEEEARASELDVNVFLPKPITASSLLNAIVEAEGHRVHSARRRLDVELENQFGGVRALLAEDNEANQMVATELLSRLGIELDIAGTGREAVEMARANPGRYAGILMDMQMPEMDGLEATRVLRADPVFREVPIIAMTANAMKADLDACLAAGMNDHIIKPIERKALVATLGRWFPKAPATAQEQQAAGSRQRAVRATPAGGAEQTPVPGEGAPSLDGINVDGALERLGLGFDSLKKMLLRFADGQGRTVDDLRAAVGAGDAASSARHAHALAGAAGNLGADALREAAKALETAARDGRGGWADLFATVEERAAIVFRSIGTLRSMQAAEATPSQAVIVDPGRLRDALGCLQAALGASDPAATEQVLAGLGAGIPSALVEDVKRIRALADEYQFDEAGVIVTRLLDSI